MSRIALSELVNLHIEEEQKRTCNPGYGGSSFAKRCRMSKTFIYQMMKDYYDGDYSSKTLESIANVLSMPTDTLKTILRSPDGKEMYLARQEKLNRLYDLEKTAPTEELDVYLNVIQSIRDNIKDKF